MRNNFNSVKAFSLIELVVVILVIGILAGLLLAVLSRGIGMARKTYCANNLRQLGNALQLFIGDNHVYPLEFNPDYDKGAYPNHYDFWDVALDHQLGYNHNSHEADFLNKGVWKCPAAVAPPDWPENVMNTGSVKIVYESYGYNSRGLWELTDTNLHGLGGQWTWRGQNRSEVPVPESEIISPSQMMAIGDGFIGHDNMLEGGAAELRRTYDKLPYVKSNSQDMSRHQSDINVVFCDGHVESPTLKFLFANTNDAALGHWNRDNQPHRENL